LTGNICCVFLYGEGSVVTKEAGSSAKEGTRNVQDRSHELYHMEINRKIRVMAYLFVSLNKTLKLGLKIIDKLQNPDPNFNNVSWFGIFNIFSFQ
jgi:hypothetical protein